MTSKSFLITGGAGFFGSHLTEFIVRNKLGNVTIVDALNYSGSLDNLRSIKMNADMPNSSTLLDKVRVLTWDFRLPAEENLVKELQDITHVIHLGALTHVDNSVIDPVSFAQTNVMGTVNVLELARKLPKLELFHQGSTDEVYGCAPMDENFTGFKEREVYNPRNPYSGSKAAAEMMVISYANTYSMPCIITNLMNLFGKRQHPEKFIPKVIKAVLSGDKLSIHSSPDLKQAGMRTYIECGNAATAFAFLYEQKPWEKYGVRNVESYNVIGEREVDNLKLANLIAEYTEYYADKLEIPVKGLNYEMVDFHSARPHHDTRYCLDGSKLRDLGWNPPSTFEKSLKETVKWYMENLNRLDT